MTSPLDFSDLPICTPAPGTYLVFRTSDDPTILSQPTTELDKDDLTDSPCEGAQLMRFVVPKAVHGLPTDTGEETYIGWVVTEVHDLLELVKTKADAHEIVFDICEHNENMGQIEIYDQAREDF